MLLPLSTDGKPVVKNSDMAANREDLVDKRQRKATWAYGCAGVLSTHAELKGFELRCGESLFLIMLATEETMGSYSLFFSATL